MLPSACGAAPGATTVVRFILESGSIQPLAGAWQLAQACLLLGIDNFSSKKTCFPSNSIGSSATASPQASRKGRANAEAASVDFILAHPGFQGAGGRANGCDDRTHVRYQILSFPKGFWLVRWRASSISRYQPWLRRR